MTLTIAEGLDRHAVAVFDADLPLVNAVRNGDESAFEELVRRYNGKLYRVAQGIIHNHEDAEEVVQAAFLKAYLNLYRFQRNSKFSTWLVRIALNESFMKLRKRRGILEQSIDSNVLSDSDSTRLPFDVADWAPNPEVQYRATELREILISTLQRLTPALKIVFVLRDIEEYSLSETSEILNLSATAVKTRLSRARLQLREELSKYFKQPE